MLDVQLAFTHDVTRTMTRPVQLSGNSSPTPSTEILYPCPALERNPGRESADGRLT